MAITLNNSTNSTGGSGSYTTHSFSHTTNAGTDSALLVVVQFTDSAGGGVTPTVTYNGVSFVDTTIGGGIDGTQQFFYQLVAPPTGANTLQVDWSSTIEAFSITAMSYDGVDQTTPIGVGATANIIESSSASASNTAATGSKLISSIVLQDGGNGPFSPSNSENELYDGETGAATDKTDVTYWVADSDQSGAFTTGATWSVANLGKISYIELLEATGVPARRILIV